MGTSRGRKEGALRAAETAAERLGATVRAWRRFRGLSLTDLALRAGLGVAGKAYLSKLEHGRIGNAGTTHLDRLAEALDISSADLLDFRQPETSDLDTRAEAGVAELEQSRARATRAAIAETLEERLDTILRATLRSALPVFRQQAHRVIDDSVPRILRMTRQEREVELFQSIIRQASHGRPMIEHVGPDATTESQDISGTEQCMRAAIQLIESAPDPAHASGKDIIITWRGERSLIESLGDPFLRERWVSALHLAIERGWNILHLVEIGQNQSKALLVVLNILALMGTRGTYRPRLLSPMTEQPPPPQQDFIIVPDRGIIELRGLREATYYRPGAYTESIERYVRGLDEHARELNQPLPRVSRAFFGAIADVEAHRGHRDTAVYGLSEGTIPAAIHRERALALARRGDKNARFATYVAATRVARERAILSQLGKYRFRDFCPERAVEQVVHHGFTSEDDTLLRLGAPRLTTEQRLTHLRTIIERMRRFRNYELVLLPDHLADLCRTFYLAKEGYAVLLEIWSPPTWQEDTADRRFDPNTRHQANILISEPVIVRAFYENPIWRPYRTYSPERKRQTIAFLEEQIAWLLAHR